MTLTPVFRVISHGLTRYGIYREPHPIRHFDRNDRAKVLDEVKTNPGGTRRAFDTGALNSAGAVDTLFFDQLQDKVNASTPFTTLT